MARWPKVSIQRREVSDIHPHLASNTVRWVCITRSPWPLFACEIKGGDGVLFKSLCSDLFPKLDFNIAEASNVKYSFQSPHELNTVGCLGEVKTCKGISKGSQGLRSKVKPVPRLTFLDLGASLGSDRQYPGWGCQLAA